LQVVKESLEALGAGSWYKVVTKPRVIEFWSEKGRMEAAFLRAISLELPTANIKW
jgi:hypothetical protein